MNKQRRKWIRGIIESLNDIQLEIENVRDEEQDAYDNMPIGFQEGVNGQAMYDNMDDLESAYSSCDEAKDYLNYILER